MVKKKATWISTTETTKKLYLLALFVFSLKVFYSLKHHVYFWTWKNWWKMKKTFYKVSSQSLHIFWPLLSFFVFNSLQGSKLPPKAASESGNSKEKTVLGKKEKSQSLIENARERLVKLERNIERRYLKPPLCKKWVESIGNYYLFMQAMSDMYWIEMEHFCFNYEKKSHIYSFLEDYNTKFIIICHMNDLNLFNIICLTHGINMHKSNS